MFLLDSSFSSPSETGPRSDSASELTRGAKCSIACLFSCGRWHGSKYYGSRNVWEVDNTSQLSRSRIEQRPPATYLRGGKASAESLTVQRSNLAVEDRYFSPLSPTASPRSGLTEFSASAEMVVSGSSVKTLRVLHTAGFPNAWIGILAVFCDSSVEIWQ